MAKDVNQTMKDSRRAAMSFLDAAKRGEERRNRRRPEFARGGGSRGAGPADEFLRAGRRAEAARDGGETDFDLAGRIRRMSDEEFDGAVADGSLTPEQIRRAGEYEFDTYMGDVWSENADNDDVPEPTYDEFVADPRRYGVTYTDEDAAGDPNADTYPVNWGRYNPARYQKR